MENFSSWDQGRRKKTGEPEGNELWKKYLLVSLLCLVMLELIWFFLFESPPGPGEANRLSISTSELEEEVAIPVYAAQIGSVGLKELAQIRQAALAPFDRFLGQNGYALSPGVFGFKKENSWLSVREAFLLPKRTTALDSAPLLGPGLVNPLLLLYPDFSASTSDGKLQWKSSGIENMDSLFPKNVQLVFYPKQQVMASTYDLTGFVKYLNQHLLNPITAADLKWNIRAFNAMDFGYHFITPNLPQFTGFDPAGISSEAVLNFSAIRPQEGVCKESSPCLHTLSAFELLPKLKINSLPAVAVFHLFHSAPKENDKPEFIFKIKFI